MTQKSFWKLTVIAIAGASAVGFAILSAPAIASATSSTDAPVVTLDTTRSSTEITAPADGWSFRNHVIPVLTKLGCNSGACHGAAAGKAGFKLTLRGYDPELDYNVLSRQ